MELLVQLYMELEVSNSSQKVHTVLATSIQKDKLKLEGK